MKDIITPEEIAKILKDKGVKPNRILIGTYARMNGYKKRVKAVKWITEYIKE